jgi:hypothetical protein
VDEQRDVDLLGETLVIREPVLAEELAVVRGDDEDGVIIDAAHLEPVDQPTICASRYAISPS